MNKEVMVVSKEFTKKNNKKREDTYYYCMSGRATILWGNIQLEGGSIGLTEGSDITGPESILLMTVMNN